MTFLDNDTSFQINPLATATTTGNLIQGPLGFSGGQSTGSSLAFVDGSLADYQSLIEGLAPGTEVITLDGSGDELLQMTQVLVGRSNLSTLAVFSHGAAGSLTLGNQLVTTDTLQSYSSIVQGWASAFTEDADILLYGCNVAAGSLGEAFIQDLSALTGADVAASTNLTGNEALGGDWTLEDATGSIETSSLFATGSQPIYQGVLATFGVTTLTDNVAGSLRAALAAANGTPGADTILFSSSLAGTITLTAGALQITDTVTIVGTGAQQIAIDAAYQYRVFEVAPVTAIITDLTLARGINGSGGAILNQGNLSLINMDIRDSVAGRGAGVFNNAGAILSIKAGNFINNQALSNFGSGEGGAIYNNGTTSAVSPTSLTITLTSFTNNSATQNGGAILNAPGRTASIDSASFEGNIAGNGFGGAILNVGVMTLNNTVMLKNAALGAGSGLGGAIANLGTFTTNNTLISEGFAVVGGGGFANLGGGAIATIKNTSFISNATNGSGGGIFNDGGRVTLRDGSLVSSNQARGTNSRGGGIFSVNAPAANFVVRSSSILSNALTNGNNRSSRGPDLSGVFSSGGFNLIGDSSGSTGFKDGVKGDTVLFPLPVFF
jgi:hypothetical protein